MKQFYLALLATFIFIQANAQTKVFKEVSDGISTEFKAIMQNGDLMGYLSFTELERADKDSFNYKITIMDENLNDLGVVKFKELKLDLQSVSFENDTLCLAYMKSNVLGYDWKNRGERNDALAAGKVAVFAQFISLDGKIAHTFEKDVKVNMRAAWGSLRNGKIGTATIKHPLQLRNLKEKGFAFFYGDLTHNYLLVLTTQGELLWEKYIVEERVDDYYMLTSGKDVYFLTQRREKELLGEYTVISYDTDTKTGILKYPMVDKDNNRLQVLSFDNDPATGKPFLSGYIMKRKFGSYYPTMKDMTKAIYKGIFSININGHEKSAVKPSFTYWDDNSTANISAKGYMSASDGYINGNTSFRDFNGNTYFAGSNIRRKIRWGSIIVAAATSPFIVPPFIVIGATGTLKFKVKDGVILRQDANGKITNVNLIEGSNSQTFHGRIPSFEGKRHSFYTVSSSDTKATFLIMTDSEKATIYNVDQNKVMRTIPHKDGNIRTNIYPAKEGHIIVSEYNRKEKYTKLSIEAI